MFFGGNNQVDKQKGKKTSGFSTRKEGQFSLGWDVSNQMNDFQVRKQQKEQSMASKVNTHKNQNIRPSVSELTFEEKCREIIEQYPDITSQELQERMALWELSNKQQVHQPSQQRSLIKPHQSAKEAIYGNTASNRTESKTSKRNQGTFSLGDGYNYFKDENNNKR